jgi:hypothetical protein
MRHETKPQLTVCPRPTGMADALMQCIADLPSPKMVDHGRGLWLMAATTSTTRCNV